MSRPDQGAETSAQPTWRTKAGWLAALAVVTWVLVLLRDDLDAAHVALALLMVVLGGSAAAGQGLGIALAVLAFFGFNFFFLEPYHTLVVAHPLDWLVLAAFLATGLVGARLLNRAQERADTARQRTAEVERLAALGAETLSAGRAEEALHAVLDVIRTTLRVAHCDILLPRRTPATVQARITGTSDAAAGTGDTWGLAAWVEEKRAVAAERADGTKWQSDPGQVGMSFTWPPHGTPLRALFVPLLVRDRLVGVLSVSHVAPFELDPGQELFLSALSYYAALGVERVGLVADAERAEALREADALKSALISGVSHDLRTPLTTIKALAQGLRAAGSAEAATIEIEADRLNRLVADLLDLSRLNARAMPVRLEVNAAEDLVGAALRQVSGTIGEGRIVVGWPGEGAVPLLAGRFDFALSLRIVVNLLENAAKYSPATEPIDLDVMRDGDSLAFRVSDRGPGVAAGERERIFEPFYRAPGAPPDVGGAGLGLAIARRLAQEQGGDVTFAPRPGGGSTFTLRVPATDAPPVGA